MEGNTTDSSQQQQQPGQVAPERRDSSGSLNPQRAASLTPAAPSAVTPALPATAVLETMEAEGDMVPTSEGPFTTSSIDSLRRGSTSSSSDYFFPDPQLSSSSPSVTDLTLPAPASEHARRVLQGARGGLYGLSTTPDIIPDPHRPATARRVSLARPPQRSKTDLPTHPEYPEQSFAALQGQEKYFHSSYFERDASSRARTASGPPDSPLLEPRKLTLITARPPRTTGSTPVQTPGLFTPAPRTAGFDASEDRSVLTSPYLHPVQVPPPRTTRSVNRDIDFYSGRKLINRYEIIDELGRGVQGKVKLARNLENDELVAIKIVQRHLQKRHLGRSDPPEDKVKKEIAILKKVQHPNVVRLIEVIDDPDIAKVYIVLEYCEQRELVWRTEGLSHIVLMEYSRQKQELGSIPSDASQAQIEKVQRMVARRRARQELERRKAPSKPAVDTPGQWSLEYATEESDENSEDDSAPSASLSRHESRATPNIMARIPEGQPLPSSEYEDTLLSVSYQFPSSTSEDRPSDFGPGSVHDVAPDEAAPATDGLEPPQIDEGFSFYSTEWYQDDAPTPDIHQLDEAIRRKREASVAETSTSSMTENMNDEVPEYYRYVPTMTLNECRSAFRDALVGLRYLHYHGIIHRDIKPENLLRTQENRVKISDFGVSYLGRPVREAEDSEEPVEVETVSWEDEKSFAKTVGTPAFFAPELCMLDGEDDTPLAKEQVDIWALGVTLFCLIFARIPFDAANNFMLMKHIREDDIFVPRQRLKAVDPTAAVRSPGHAPLFQKDKRNPQDFELEAIDDELYDLLQHLFKRNPEERLSLQEIKHQPWVLRGIPDPITWLDETDPARVGHGKKIEPSSEEVEEAVMPITILSRLKSIGKRATSAFGLGGPRKRGQSSANSSETGSTSSISELDKVGRRQSIQVGPLIYASHRSQRERELDHPLSRSVTTSPEPEARVNPPSPTSSPLNLRNRQQPPTSRPALPDRQVSEVSTRSIRTVRPSDFSDRGRPGTSHSPPGPNDMLEIHQPTPTATPTTFQSILSGGARTILRAAMRSRERFGSGSASPNLSSGSRTPAEHDQPVGEPTAAVTIASVPGHIDFPAHLKERLSAISDSTPTSAERQRPIADSSYSSGKQSTAQLSRQTSMLSEGHGKSFLSPFHTQPSSGTHTPSLGKSGRSTPAAELSSDQSASNSDYRSRSTQAEEAAYRHAKEDMSRRAVLQAVQDRELSDASRPSRSFGQKPCPPSPDDQQKFDPLAHQSSPPPSQEAPLHPLTLASSDDTSSASHSRSTSFPSVPSAVSADSSVWSEAQSAYNTKDSAGSDETHTGEPNPSSAFPSTSSVAASDPGYHGDGDGNGEDTYAVESESDDTDSDGDGGLVMMSRRTDNRVDNTTSISQLPASKERRGTALSRRKESGSGSTNTMTKVRTQSPESREADEPLSFNF